MQFHTDKNLQLNRTILNRDTTIYIYIEKFSYT